jgi:hypothetical protein
MPDNEAEIIEAMAEAAYSAYPLGKGPWATAHETIRMVRLTEARAALNAAGAAVERDSSLVAEEVPDLGNTITEQWERSQRIGNEINALIKRIEEDKPDGHTLGRWLVAFSMMVQHPDQTKATFIEPPTQSASGSGVAADA